jgi:23S rRNA (guanosine2251-2'-O)-methyltransferase
MYARYAQAANINKPLQNLPASYPEKKEVFHPLKKHIQRHFLHYFSSCIADYLCRMRKLAMKELGRKTPEEFRLSEKIPIIVVLENIRSAYNVGSIFRTCDAFLIEAIYIIGYSAKPPHKEIRKTALGAEETVTWKHFPTIVPALQDLRNAGFGLFAVEQAEGSFKLNAIGLEEQEKIAVVFGNEVTGVEQSTIALCDGCIEIPQLGMKHSLNVATAAGVVLWELVRKRIKTI